MRIQPINDSCQVRPPLLMFYLFLKNLLHVRNVEAKLYFTMSCIILRFPVDVRRYQVALYGRMEMVSNGEEA